jgi:rare lipoprotein A
VLCAALAGAPALALLHAPPPPSAAPAHLAAAVSVAAGGGQEPSRPVADRVSRSEAPVTSEAPTTVPMTTATTVLPRVRSTAPKSTTTTVVRRTTTTVKAAPKSAPAPSKSAPPKSSSGPSASAAPSGRTESGGATWYDAAPPGTCAHRTLPFGTVVTITSQSTGATATCTVSDRGPYVDGLIIDLAKDVFSKLAPMSQGVVQVRISW